MHRAAKEEKEAGGRKKGAAPAKKGKQARVWGDAPAGKGEPALRAPRAAAGLRSAPALPCAAVLLPARRSLLPLLPC